MTRIREEGKRERGGSETQHGSWMRGRDGDAGGLRSNGSSGDRMILVVPLTRCSSLFVPGGRIAGYYFPKRLTDRVQHDLGIYEYAEHPT